MKNNKLTRKRSAPKQLVAVQQDGTEVLHDKASRSKQRRWSFLADVAMADLPVRTLKLSAISYGSVRDVRVDCKQHELYLKASNKMFETAKVRVRAVPHETISQETMRQIIGYRDMAAILDRALDRAILEAADVVLGKSVGSQFIEMPAREADGDKPAVLAVTLRDIKESFYRRALEELTPKQEQQQDPVVKEEKCLITTP